MSRASERFASQFLSGAQAPTMLAAAQRLLAIQGQDPRGSRLALRARVRGAAVDAIDDALTVERSLVVTWVNRGTLHLVPAEDVSWLQMLTTPQFATGNARRLMQEGVSPDVARRAVGLVKRALDGGPMTRHQVRELLDGAGIPTAGQALIHILFRATLEGVCVRGPLIGSDQAYVAAGDWLSPQPRIDRDAALGELARRYLAGHAPADERDLVKWAGIALRDARTGFQRIAAGLHSRPDGGYALTARDPLNAMPRPRLLGPFDPVLHGWASREFVVGPMAHLVTSNGMFRAFAMVNGKAVATWSMAGKGCTVEYSQEVSDADRAALEQDAARVVAFMGGEARRRYAS